MRWYRVFYGSWKDANGVQRVCETESGKEAFGKAQRAADEHGVEVTVLWEGHSGGYGVGRYVHVDKVRPSEQK